MSDQPAHAGRSPGLFHDLGQVADDRLDIAGGKLVECVVRLDLLALVQDRRHIGFLGNLVGFWSLGTIQG